MGKAKKRESTEDNPPSAKKQKTSPKKVKKERPKEIIEEQHPTKIVEEQSPKEIIEEKRPKEIGEEECIIDFKNDKIIRILEMISKLSEMQYKYISNVELHRFYNINTGTGYLNEFYELFKDEPVKPLTTLDTYRKSVQFAKIGFLNENIKYNFIPSLTKLLLFLVERRDERYIKKIYGYILNNLLTTADNRYIVYITVNNMVKLTNQKLHVSDVKNRNEFMDRVNLSLQEISSV